MLSKRRPVGVGEGKVFFPFGGAPKNLIVPSRRESRFLASLGMTKFCRGADCNCVRHNYTRDASADRLGRRSLQKQENQDPPSQNEVGHPETQDGGIKPPLQVHLKSAFDQVAKELV